MIKIKKWEIAGAIITIVAGSLLHFVFQWSGSFKPLALIAAVNESTWEHLKLAFWPAFIFAVIEYFAFGRKNRNFCLATMVKLFSMPVIIILLFYGWLIFFEDNFIWDISIFVFAVIVGYHLSYRTMKIEKDLRWGKISAVLITIGLIKFSLFTFFPPHNFLFQDPVDGNYGIEK